MGETQGVDGLTYEVQLKGAGLTPYSRTLDGRYELSAAIREYLAGEALTALGIPGTRTLCLLGGRTKLTPFWIMYRGLTPHKIIPMPGTYKTLYLIAHAPGKFNEKLNITSLGSGGTIFPASSEFDVTFQRFVYCWWHCLNIQGKAQKISDCTMQGPFMFSSVMLMSSLVLTM